MDSFDKPIGNAPKDPYEGYRVEPVEEKHPEQRGSQRQRQEEPEKKETALGAFFSLAFRKLAEIFQESKEKGVPSADEAQIRGHLVELRAFLEILKKEDRSQDAPFINNLSKLWQSILEDSLHFRRDSQLSKQFKSLILSIESYPPGQSHSLSYYLREFAGQKWLPFPFMEILQKLQSDHQKNPSNSYLEAWTDQVQNILPLLAQE